MENGLLNYSLHILILLRPPTNEEIHPFTSQAQTATQVLIPPISKMRPDQ